MTKLKFSGFLIIPIALIAIAAFVLNSNSNTAPTGSFVETFSEDEEEFVLPDSPIHWHPRLSILIDWEKQEIPANIGIGNQYSDSPFYDHMMSMTNMHTHDTSGTLHWEVMMHAPTEEDLYLGNFFQVWGKTFDNNCIMDYCNKDGKSVKMFVNGELNQDYEKYMVKNGDNIVIRYE